jgi:hypothetical protein
MKNGNRKMERRAINQQEPQIEEPSRECGEKKQLRLAKQPQSKPL